MIVLAHYKKDERFQQYFTVGERATAIHIAKQCLKRGEQPFLYHIGPGKLNVLFNWRNHQKKVAKKAA